MSAVGCCVINEVSEIRGTFLGPHDKGVLLFGGAIFGVPLRKPPDGVRV